MKRGLFIIISIFVLIVLIRFVIADVGPGPKITPYITGCSKITNLNEFPNIAFVGYTSGPGIIVYIINNNDCLRQGKNKDLQIYAVDKTYLENKSLLSINLSTDKNFLLSDYKIQWGSRSSYYTNPLENENISYKIAGFSNDKLIIYESERVDSYNDGQADKINISQAPQISDLRTTIKVDDIPPVPTPPTPIPSQSPTLSPPPAPVKKVFWASIGCFFTRLFGGKC